MDKRERDTLYELLQVTARQHYEVIAMPSAVDNELRELVEKGAYEPVAFGYVCRHLLGAMKEVKKAEKNYLNAKSTYQSRVQDVLAVLEK